MAIKTSDDARACKAFIETLRRTENIMFFKKEIIVSEKKKIGDPVVCIIDAQKMNDDSSQARGMAYIYPDLVIVCVESVSRKSMEPIYPHQYEYLSY
jgi:hypothetical protein